MRLLAACLALVLSLAARADVTSPSGRLRFVPGPGAVGLAESLAATGDRDRDLVAKDLGRDWDGTTEVRVALDEPSFRALLPKDALVPKWAEGVAFPERNLVVLRGFPGDPEARATLRHELSHVAVERLTRNGVPRWFTEGLAMVREDKPWSDAGPSLIVAAITRRLMPFSQLTRGFPAGRSDAELAYAESADFVAFLVGRSGEPAVREVLADVVAGRRFDDAMRARLGRPLPELEREWRRSLVGWALFVQLATSSELGWLVLALIVIYAGLRMRARRRRAMAKLEAEDKRDDLRAFAAEPAYWADEPRTPSPPATEPEPEDELDEHLDRLAHLQLGDDGEDDDEGEADEPKKPTLH